MTDIGDVIKFIVAARPGITDRELAEAIYGWNGPRPTINRECNRLERFGALARRLEHDAVANYPGPALGVIRNRQRRVTAIH